MKFPFEGWSIFRGELLPPPPPNIPPRNTYGVMKGYEGLSNHWFPFIRPALKPLFLRGSFRECSSHSTVRLRGSCFSSVMKWIQMVWFFAEIDLQTEMCSNCLGSLICNIVKHDYFLIPMVIYHLTENTKKSHMFRFGHMLRTHFSALFSLQIPGFVAFKMDRFLGWVGTFPVAIHPPNLQIPYSPSVYCSLWIGFEILSDDLIGNSASMPTLEKKAVTIQKIKVTFYIL